MTAATPWQINLSEISPQCVHKGIDKKTQIFGTLDESVLEL